MNKTMTLRLVTPQGEETVEEITGLVTRLMDGSIGILPGHAPLVADTAGEDIVCRLFDGEERRITPGPAILQVERNVVTVFAAGAGLDDVRIPQRLLSAVVAQRAEKGIPEGDEG